MEIVEATQKKERIDLNVPTRSECADKTQVCPVVDAAATQNERVNVNVLRKLTFVQLLSETS